MKKKKPLAKSYDVDQRFSAGAALKAATRRRAHVCMPASSWDTLKEWVLIEFGDQEPCSINPKVLRKALWRSRPSKFGVVKRILLKRNWPMILDVLVCWRRNNPGNRLV